MGKYFGTDGFRGEAGVNLTADHAYKVGRFLGWYYNALRERSGNNEPARIVIGKDTRRSSYMFEYSLVAGLTASGADAYLLHVTTTPSVAYIARVDDFDCGIMISASHNPFYDNGIKLIDCYGEKMPEETLLLVEDYIDGKLHVFDQDWPELPFAHREHIGCTVDYVAGRNRYMGYLISLGIYSFKGIKVGLDCANGASWNIAKSVFDALGADTYVINNQPNGLNINLNAGSTHIEGLQKFVVEKARSKIISSISLFSQKFRISSTMPLPTHVAVSGEGRFCIIVAIGSAPPLFTSSHSSRSDSSASYSPVSSETKSVRSGTITFSV